MSELRILRFKEVSAKVGLGRTCLYRMMGNGTFPKPIKITNKASGWKSDEIDKWIKSRRVAVLGDKSA